MSCRDHPISSAITSYGRIANKLADRQDQDVFHTLVSEGAGTEHPGDWEIEDFINETIDKINLDPNISPKRKGSILERLEEAKQALEDGTGKPVTGPVMYAMRRFYDRCKLARRNLDTYLDAAARDIGVSRPEMQAILDEHMAHAVQAGRYFKVDEEWEETFRAANPDIGIPMDRASVYAYQQIENQRATSRAMQPIMPAVTLDEIDSDMFNGIGYNPELGYMEIEFKSKPGKVYSYRIPPDIYNDFRSSPDPEAYYQSKIRGNPEYTFKHAAEWNAIRTLRKCVTCGRFFSGDACDCPVRGSQEEINRTIRLARAAIVGTPSEQPEPVVTMPTPAKWRHYTNGEGDTSTVPLTEAQTLAKTQGIVAAPVKGAAKDSEGEYRQEGTLYIEYLGYGQGFYVTAVTNPGDSENQHLRCDCPEYAIHYTCKHVRAIVADTANRLNGTTIKKPETTPAERLTNPDDMVPSRPTARVHWEDPESSWLTNPEMFEDIYEKASKYNGVGEYPIPYFYNKVTDGMGNERKFGLEIEWDYPEDMTPEEQEQANIKIGRALYRMGLLPSPRQEEYEEQKERGYSENHEKGWAFKKDLTCKGEVTSPVMGDTEETWINVERVMNVIRKNGGVVSQNTGFHVHVSVSDYKDSPTSHSKLINTFTANEDILYRLGTDPESKTHRGDEHCARNKAEGLGYKPISEVKLKQGDRDVMVNFDSVTGNDNDHVEIRLWNGCLTPQRAQALVTLSLAVVQDGMRDTGTQEVRSSGALGEKAKKHSLGGNITLEEDSKEFRALIDRLLISDRAKTMVSVLYATAPWQKSRDEQK